MPSPVWSQMDSRLHSIPMHYSSRNLKRTSSSSQIYRAATHRATFRVLYSLRHRRSPGSFQVPPPPHCGQHCVRSHPASTSSCTIPASTSTLSTHRRFCSHQSVSSTRYDVTRRARGRGGWRVRQETPPTNAATTTTQRQRTNERTNERTTKRKSFFSLYNVNAVRHSPHVTHFPASPLRSLAGRMTLSIRCGIGVL